jgi:hypothetical protein
MVNCPDIARAQIERMEAEGIKLTLDNLTTLILTARAVENPRPPMIPGITVPPVAVCDGVVMWPATLQAALWYRHAQGFWAKTDELVMAYAYALVHGREAGHFDGLYDERTARKTVERWARSLPVTGEELSACVIAVSPESFVAMPEDPNSKKAEWGDILSELVSMTGQSIEYWTTHTPDCILDVLEKCYKVRVLTAGGKWNEGGPRDEMMQFMRACMEIRSEHGK